MAFYTGVIKKFLLELIAEKKITYCTAERVFSTNIGEKDASQHVTIFLSLFIYFERQRQRKWGRGRERGTKRIPSRLCAVRAEPDVGLDLTIPDLTNKIKRPSTN